MVVERRTWAHSGELPQTSANYFAYYGSSYSLVHRAKDLPTAASSSTPKPMTRIIKSYTPDGFVMLRQDGLL